MFLGIPERGLSLQIQVASAANAPPAELKIHRLQFSNADGKKCSLRIDNPLVPAGDPWGGNWLDAKDGEVAALIEYSFTGPGANKDHIATASLRRAY